MADREPDGSPYLDSVERSILECVAALEFTSTFLTTTARAFTAEAATFADQVARLKAVAGLTAAHPSEQ